MADVIEEKLHAISLELARISGRLATHQLPRVLTKERAAKELSISLSKLKRLLRDGVLMSVAVGRRRMVPAVEIERLATPAQATPRRHLRSIGGSSNGRKYDAEGEAKAMRDAIRRR